MVQALVFTVFFCLILLPFETKTDLCRSGGLFQDLRAVFDLVTCFGIVDRLVHAGFIPLRPPDKAITDIAGTAGGNGLIFIWYVSSMYLTSAVSLSGYVTMMRLPLSHW